MGIPSPLAFPPTALRNVAAGLVVGNPIGSSGTRGKALTAAELKAIVEASGISYLPLSGGTLTGALSLGSNGFTCGAITASGAAKFNNYSASKYWQFETGANGIFRYYSAAGPSYNVQIVGDSTGSGGSPRVMLTSGGSIEWGDNASSLSVSTMDLILKRANAGVLAQRNGINAQCHILSKTYTSAALQEALMLDAGKQISGKLGLYSYRGSIGGSNYPIQIGMLAADGTTFTGMTVPVTGPVSLSRDLVMNGTYPYFGLVASSWSGGTFYFQAGVDSAGTGTGNFTGLLNPLGKSFAVVSGNPNTTGRLHLTIDGTTSSAVFAGQITLSASTTAVASLNLPSGTAPTSPANGDIWSDGSDIKVRLGGVTYTLSKV